MLKVRTRTPIRSVLSLLSFYRGEDRELKSRARLARLPSGRMGCTPRLWPMGGPCALGAGLLCSDFTTRRAAAEDGLTAQVLPMPPRAPHGGPGRVREGRTTLPRARGEGGT